MAVIEGRLPKPGGLFQILIVARLQLEVHKVGPGLPTLITFSVAEAGR
jgi:hypothetical protein